MTKNFLFIDDSGSKNWETPYSSDFLELSPESESSLKYRNFWQFNYFVLAGVHITSDVVAELNPLIHQAKHKVFGTKDVEIHSVEIRNPFRQQKKYLDRFNISTEDLREFIDNFWYPLYSQYPLELVAIVVDKRYFTNEMRAKTPLEIAAEALFEQTKFHPHKDCEIIFDQMDSQLKTSRREQGKVLRIADTKIELEDGRFENKFHHTAVRFEQSKNSNFLQLADTVAYNVWRQFIDHGNDWDIHSSSPDEHRNLPTYPYFEKISSNFYRDSDNVVEGVGIIKLPMNRESSRRWRIS